MSESESDTKLTVAPSVETLFNEHYRRLGPMVFRYLYRQCRDRRDAEELQQDVFVRLYRALVQQPSISVRPWVFKVARNLVLDHRKHLRRVGLRMDPMAADNADRLTDSSPTAEARFIQMEREIDRTERLLAARQRLTFKQRACLDLRNQGLKLREIGVLLEMDERRVGEVLISALKKLSKELGTDAVPAD